MQTRRMLRSQGARGPSDGLALGRCMQQIDLSGREEQRREASLSLDSGYA